MSVLDEGEFPETCGYLKFVASDDEYADDNPFDVANRLLRCDKPAPFPAALRDFIEELFEEAFAEGSEGAMNDLGAQYYDGSRGFEQDFTKAVNCYKLAAEKGCRQAQENLGYCYYYGRNMPVDYKKAFHYFALGAFDGHLISLYKIGDMYQNGYYVEKNPEEAFRIWSRCLETMTEQAAQAAAGPVYLRMENALLDGIGTKEDPKRALTCFQKAETYLFDMIADGNYMYKKSWRAAIDGQARAREKLADTLPDREWSFD